MVITNHHTEFDLSKFRALVLDMDGVVTDTARVHAMAWKHMFDEYLRQRAEERDEKYEPFDPKDDYLRYVDGKPRYDGARSFLESRGISIPYGSPTDPPDKETVCGLGNRKNGYFLKQLKIQGATVYTSTIDLVKMARRKGLKIAVISASRNAKAVLESAGVAHIFDAIVDGVLADDLGLKGKPGPDIFLEAAKRLSIDPGDAIVIEDALAGVEAGKSGGFGLVIGVDRDDHGDELRRRGADIVVGDLSELPAVGSGTGEDAPETVAASTLPSALEKQDEIFRRLRRGMPAIFLDYDGTLTPIVKDPKDARLPEETRRIIVGLSEHWPVAILSGRDLRDVQSMVKVDNIIYAGSHGFDIAGAGEAVPQENRGQRYLPALDAAETELRDRIAGIRGAWVERKRFAIALHYRGADSKDVPSLENLVDEVESGHPELVKSAGKKVFELRPDSDWDKGKALLSILDASHIDPSKAVAVYIGDDTTDEDAFREIRDTGITIRVGDSDRMTSARYGLRDTTEVATFLSEMLEIAEKGIARGMWVLAYEGYDPDQEKLRESLCTLGNGYFATRGAAPEASADGVHYPGTYLAGTYNRLQSTVQGKTIENESIVNAPNWLPLTFSIEDGAWFDAGKVDILEYRQDLDMRKGMLTRTIRFKDAEGRGTRVIQRRFAHMGLPHLAGLETTIRPEDWSGRIRFRSAIDARVDNSLVERYSSLNSQHLNQLASGQDRADTVWLEVETNQSHIRIAQAARTTVRREGRAVEVARTTTTQTGYAAQEFEIEVEPAQPVSVEKIVAMYTSREHAISAPLYEALKEVTRAADFDHLLERHVLGWDHLWERCRISVEAEGERTAQILNLHIFHLLQTVSVYSIDRDVGVPPRGLHGEAYRGLIMWDELFIFPFLSLRIPDLTRALLQYRYRRLPEARCAAHLAGYEGAMFPWQSGSDGREEAQTLHLNPRSGRWIPDNTHLQRHISIAVAYNVWQYYQVTGDMDFLCFYGAEMILEIARFLASISEYNHSRDRYEIRGVMGPDEFHDRYPGADEPGLDNNAYTNVMTVWVLLRALELLDTLPESRRKAVWEDLALRKEELERWEDITKKMRVVFHGIGIVSQFEGYADLREFDWHGYREKYGDIHRLDRILEAEGDSPNRYKVSKQADALMLFYLLSADELRSIFQLLGYDLNHEDIPRNIDYYMKRTSHGSTLSGVVHSWVSSRSRRDESWHLFRNALESDVSDIQGGTTNEGIHLGAMAGTVDLVQRCYPGIEVRGDVLWFNPYLPAELRRIEFNIGYRKHSITVRITAKVLQVSSSPDHVPPVRIGFSGETYNLKPGESLEFELSD